MDLLTNPITAQIISICVAAACGWLGAQATRLRKRDEALYEGMKAVLRKEIVDDYDRYVLQGNPMSLERKREIDECYAAYTALGGNGTGRTLYEQISKITPYVITIKED